MTIQLLQTWNGNPAGIYTWDSGEESRLIGIGLARSWGEGQDGPLTPRQAGIVRMSSQNVSALAAAGGLTPFATYVASDTGAKAEARSATQLDWPNARTVSVAPGTGVAATDAAAIRAAFVAAGANGVVRLAAKSVYAYGGKGGRIFTVGTSSAPSVIDLNGSTLLHSGFVSTATTTGNYSAGSNVVVQLNAGGAANFLPGDYVSIQGANYSDFITSSTTSITAIDYTLDRITLSSLSFTSGSSTGAGPAFVQHDDSILLINSAIGTRSAAQNTILCNGRVDGNAAVRIAAGLRQQWGPNPLVYALNICITVRDVVFINAPADALQLANAPYLKVTGCHFENIFGNGVHPGSDASVTVDSIVSGNSFYNVTQATDVSTPTIAQFGHASQSGAIINSIGPVKMVVADNVIDTTTRAGFSAVTSTDTDYAISGNVFANCGAGAFQVVGGKNVAITGNHCLSCGRDVDQGPGGTFDQTGVRGNGGADQNTVITGNTFIDTPLIVMMDGAAVTISGNLMNTSGLTNVTGSTNVKFYASLVVLFSGVSYGSSRLTINGNTIINPINATSPLKGILLSRGKDVNIVGNTIIGGRFGLDAQCGSANPLINVRVADNIFTDQGLAGGGGANPVAISWNAGSCKNCSIENNTISAVNSSTVALTAMFLFSNTYAASSLRICGNTIRSDTTRMVGIKFNTSINYTGSNITVSHNDVELANVADAPFTVPTTGTLSGIFFLMNRTRGGSGLPSWGTNVSTIGGGTDSNWAV